MLRHRRASGRELTGLVQDLARLAQFGGRFHDLRAGCCESAQVVRGRTRRICACSADLEYLLGGRRWLKWRIYLRQTSGGFLTAALATASALTMGPPCPASVEQPILGGMARRPLAPDERDEFPPRVLLGLGGHERCAEPAPVSSSDCPSRQIAFTHGPANVAGLWTAPPPRFAPPSLDYVLAGYAFALEHEVLAEGRCGRLISGLRSAVQSLLGGPEGCHRRPD